MLTIWIGLCILYVPLTRSMQPSPLMTVLAVGILMGCSKLLPIRRIGAGFVRDAERLMSAMGRLWPDS
jgi:hypothetical protein